MFIIAAQYGTISDIEIMFGLIALFGLIFSLYNVREAQEDIGYLRERNIGNGRMKIAVFARRAEIARATIQSIFVMLAIMAMLFPDQPSLPNEPLKLVIYRFLFVWGLMISAALLSLKSYWNWHLRRELLDEGSRDNDPAPQEEDPERET